MIDRAKFNDDRETWVKAHKYRREFLETVYKEQLFLAAQHITWTDSNLMPVSERKFALHIIQEAKEAAKT